MTAGRQRWRDALAALSIANITFLRNWNEILTYTQTQAFFFRALPGVSLAAAAALNVLGLSFVFYGIIRWVRWTAVHHGTKRAVLVGLLLLPLPANSVAGILSAYLPDLAPQTFLPKLSLLQLTGLLLVSAGMLSIALRWSGATLKLAAFLAIQLAPLTLLEGASVVWHVATDDHQRFSAFQVAKRVKQQPGTSPVVWLLIDELDYRLLFEDRPRQIRMPNFDRLRREGLSSADATPPGPETILSVPSLLTGRRYTKVNTDEPDLLRGQARPGEPLEDLRASDTVFGSAYAMGRNVAVAGWYIPYCRIFGAAITDCAWYSFGTRINVYGQTFGEQLRNQLQAPFETATYSPFSQSVPGRYRIFNATHLREDALNMLRSQDVGFIYIHHMATHYPYVYDRGTGAFSKTNSPVMGYSDALEWADIFLGEVRATMEASGKWEHATVLVTADHSFRRSREFDGKWDVRVPWMLKLPGQKTPLSQPGKMHTIVTKKLLELVMRGEITTHEQASAWVSSHDAEIVAESERHTLPQQTTRR